MVSVFPRFTPALGGHGDGDGLADLVAALAAPLSGCQRVEANQVFRSSTRYASLTSMSRRIRLSCVLLLQNIPRCLACFMLLLLSLSYHMASPLQRFAFSKFFGVSCPFQAMLCHLDM